jgi:RimJ/RimL family protein N-acetyltransferase
MALAHPPLAAYRRAEFHTLRFRLRPIGEADQPLMYRWRSDAQTSRFLGAPAPVSLQNQLDWFYSIRDNPAYCYHIIEDDGEPIGFTALINTDPARADAEWGVVLGKYRGRGLVRVIAPLYCKCALTLMGLDSIYTCIHHKNIAAIRKMEQVGAVLVDGPHTYRKSGELLFRIDSNHFKEKLREFSETDPEWDHHLDVKRKFVC